MREGMTMTACVRTIMKEVAAGRGPSFDEVDATRTWLASQPGCSGRIGVVGFCMSGGFALALAANHGFSASAVNYGRHPEAAKVLDGACPIIGSFGKRDFGLRGAAVELEGVLREKAITHDVKEYPKAGHLFLDQFDAGDGYRLLFAALRMLGQGYEEEAASDARRRITSFFNQHLR
jgi:carboxymethylenebutenolidase